MPDLFNCFIDPIDIATVQKQNRTSHGLFALADLADLLTFLALDRPQWAETPGFFDSIFEPPNMAQLLTKKNRRPAVEPELTWLALSASQQVERTQPDKWLSCTLV